MEPLDGVTRNDGTVRVKRVQLLQDESGIILTVAIRVFHNWYHLPWSEVNREIGIRNYENIVTALSKNLDSGFSSLSTTNTNFRLDVPKALVVPVPHEVPGHELVVGEGQVLVPQRGHHLPGVRAPVCSVQLEPARGRAAACGHGPDIEAAEAEQGPCHRPQMSPDRHY